MPRESLISVDVTDPSGRTEAEWVRVEAWDGGRVIRFVLDDGSSWVLDGPQILAAVEPDDEQQIRAA